MGKSICIGKTLSPYVTFSFFGMSASERAIALIGWGSMRVPKQPNDIACRNFEPVAAGKKALKYFTTRDICVARVIVFNLANQIYPPYLCTLKKRSDTLTNNDVHVSSYR